MPDGAGYALWTPVLRSSHLERLPGVPGLRLLASGRHPDCDDALLAAAPLPVVLGDLAALADDLRSDPPDVLEVTEPLWTAQWPDALRLADAAPGARLVTYAIEVLPPPDPPVADRLGAVAFGSQAARDAYDLSYPGAGWATTVVEERRDRCGACFPADPALGGDRVPAARELVFAAEFSERKAVDLLMAAWDAAAVPGWRLRLLGWGPRTDQVVAWGAGRPDVEVVVAAGRAVVHDALRRAAAVVLPSRRVPGWREQIGLSIVEGLAHGCHVVATDETGLAAGLRAAGHTVLPAGDGAALAQALASVLPQLPPDKQLPGGRGRQPAPGAGLAGAGRGAGVSADDPGSALLAREATSLVARLRLFTPARWAAAAPPYGTRADAVHHLAQWLADVVGEAPVRLPRLDSDLALPDQLAVTADDLVRARLPADDAGGAPAAAPRRAARRAGAGRARHRAVRGRRAGAAGAGTSGLRGVVSYPPQRYSEPQGQVRGLLRARAAPPDLTMPAVDVHHLATGATTGGDFGLYRWEMTGRPTGPAAHFHRTITESFYVLAGTVRLYDGARWVDARPGDFLHVPPGGVHAFRNESGEPASMLLLFTPGAPREAYFAELADIAATGRQLSPEQWTELYARHDQYEA